MVLLRNCLQTPHEIEVKHDKLLNLGPEQLILRVLMITQGRSLYMRAVPTWLNHKWCLEALHTRFRLVTPFMMII